MHSAIGVFSSWDAAEQAARDLGLPEDRLSIVAGDRREPEETGIGAPLGGAVAGFMGAAAGSAIGTGVAAMVLPGVGAVIATGVAAALVLGAGAAAIGATAGEELEEATEIHPPARDTFFCEEALRRGRVIVLATAETAEQANSIRGRLAAEGAESLDVTRQDWWHDLREAERTAYHGDFSRDEEIYRRGFEAALEPANRGKRLPDDASVSAAYRSGYDRGKEYYDRLVLRLS
jgi:hypothetical protein